MVHEPLSDGKLTALRSVGVRLSHCVAQATDRFNAVDPAMLATMTPRTKASLFHDILTETVQVEVADDPEVQYLETRGLRHIATPEARIRFKKLNRDLRASSIPTGQSQQWVQPALPGLPEAPVPLHFGYRTNRLWSEIMMVALVRQEGRTVTWFEEFELEEAVEPEIVPTPIPTEWPVRLKPDVVKARQAELDDAAREGSDASRS